jgi:bifunctional DNA-binding transcriptional regulator/antitoxin component of YhaV-PrlF toxin-antitoxin module
MTTTGYVRRFDEYGRIVIPREVRKNVFGRIDVQDIPMEVFYNEDGSIVLRPYKERGETENE